MPCGLIPLHCLLILLSYFTLCSFEHSYICSIVKHLSTKSPHQSFDQCGLWLACAGLVVSASMARSGGMVVLRSVARLYVLVVSALMARFWSLVVYYTVARFYSMVVSAPLARLLYGSRECTMPSFPTEYSGATGSPSRLRHAL